MCDEKQASRFSGDERRMLRNLSQRSNQFQRGRLLVLLTVALGAALVDGVDLET